PIQIQENAPDRYTVVKGDTLWAISGRFLKQPWRWPEVWRMNKDQIRNPHLIYPGQIVVLDRNAPGGPRLMIEDANASRGGVVRLSPSIRGEAREAQPIISLNPSDVEPFMVRNLVIGAEAFADAPQIVRSQGERVAMAQGDPFYAVGVKPEMGKVFQVFRRGRELRDTTIPARPWYKWRHNEPDPQIIGYEGEYLGDAKLLNEGDVAKFEVVTTRQEILVGDYLIPTPPSEQPRYIPRAPEKEIDALIMTIPTGVQEAAKTSVVTLNRGALHGVELGHVLAIYKNPVAFKNPRYKESTLNWIPGWPKQPSADPQTLTIPEERIGLVFIYKVFDHVSYGMVMNTGKEPVVVGNRLRNP
ncbi:MAG: LysM peptidoglycan-binding domain-containing protein, partial [Casimicrobium sp.]